MKERIYKQKQDYSSAGGSNVSAQEIDTWIYNAINDINEGECVTKAKITYSGNTLLIVSKSSSGWDILVAKNTGWVHNIIGISDKGEKDA